MKNIVIALNPSKDKDGKYIINVIIKGLHNIFKNSKINNFK